MKRENLDDFVSLICVKSIITGVENALGEQAVAIALIAAGRSRGKNLAVSLGLNDSQISLKDLALKLNFALGNNGIKLCLIEKIEQTDNLILVHAKETILSFDNEQGLFRGCNYTLGVVWGVLETVYGQRYLGSHLNTSCSNTYDIFEFKNAFQTN